MAVQLNVTSSPSNERRPKWLRLGPPADMNSMDRVQLGGCGQRQWPGGCIHSITHRWLGTMRAEALADCPGDYA